MRKHIARLLPHIPGFRALQASPTPRWIIFTIDLAIIAFVAALVFVFPPSFFGANPATQQYSYFLLIISYALCNLITGAYRGIIRLSVPYDLLKVVWCVLGASALTCAVSISYAIFSESKRLLVGILPVILIGTVAMSLMLSLRIIVKYLYGYITMLMSRRKPVVILGTSIPSLGLAATLRHENDGEFMPVALLTTDPHHHENKLQGLPVIHIQGEDVAQAFNKYGSDTLIFLQEHTELLRAGLADRFIDAGINLKVLNQVEEFDVDADSGDMRVSGHVSSVKIEDLLGRPVIHTDSHRVREDLHEAVVLVTGAAGSIGSEIVRQVARFSAKTIILLDQAETPMHDMQLELRASYPDSDIYYYVGDVQNRDRLQQIFHRHHPTHVYHAAAYKHVPMMEQNPTEAILTNVMGTRQLSDLALQYGVRKFVMISTDKAVNPTNIMGASKRIAEIYVQSLFFRTRQNHESGATQFITTRFGNVLGSNGSVIPLFRHQIETGGPVTITHRDIIRYFMTISEACSLVLEAGTMGHGGEIFLFDMGQPVRIYDLALRMIRLAGLKPDKDIKIIETGLRPGEKLYEELLNDKEKTLPTGNDKIMIARVREYDYTAVLPHIESLVNLAAQGRVHDMVMAMKSLVPEYISNNSRFEAIDRELGHTKENKNLQRSH